MAVIGIELEPDELVLTRGRDFSWAFENLDETGNPIPFPDGELFFEFALDPVVTWEFTISDETATLKVEHDDADAIPARTKWQLVFLPDGEDEGGEAVALGTVRRQG